jgi:hypothetical protein
MVYETSRSKWMIYSFLVLLILVCNYTLYHQTLFYPLDEKLVIASLIDFILVIPILTYFIIIRKRYSLKVIGLPLLGGYAAAYLIIPDDLLQSFSQLSWIILAIEGLFISVEVLLLYKVVMKLPKLKKEFTRITGLGVYFPESINQTLESVIKNNTLRNIWTTELSIYYFSLFSYRKKVGSQIIEHTFSYHKNTSAIALNIMLIHAIVIETLGLHYFLHQVNPVVSYILLLLNVYSVFLFLAEIQAIRLCPIQIIDKELLIQIGMMKRIKVPISNIVKFEHYNGPDTFSKAEEKHIFNARVNDLIQEKPMFDIHLKTPIYANLLYGFTKEINRIVLTVDDPNRFYQTLTEYIERDRTDSL